MNEHASEEFIRELCARIEPCYGIRSVASHGPITAVWYGNSSPHEERLEVVNHETGKQIYVDTPLFGMDAEYNVDKIAREVAESRFIIPDDPHPEYESRRYGPHGLIDIVWAHEADAVRYPRIERCFDE
jgi:hypothetical protein